MKRSRRRYRLAVYMLLLACTDVAGVGIANADEKEASNTSQACWLDLDRDGTNDIAVFVPGEGSGKLIALLARGDAYEGRVLMSGPAGMILACRLGDTVTETTAARLEGKRYETGGTYVTFTQPEGAAYAYFWSGSKFQEVLLAD